MGIPELHVHRGGSLKRIIKCDSLTGITSALEIHALPVAKATLDAQMDELIKNDSWFVDRNGEIYLAPLVDALFTLSAKSAFEETGQRGAIVFDLHSDPRDASFVPQGEKIFESEDESVTKYLSEYNPAAEYVAVAIDPQTDDYTVFWKPFTELEPFEIGNA